MDQGSVGMADEHNLESVPARGTDDGGKRLLDPRRLGLVLGVGAQTACSVMDTSLTPSRRRMDLKAAAVLALDGEAGELPDQHLPERGVRLESLVDHLAELGPVGDAPTLGLVHVLADDAVAVLLGVVPERPQLGGSAVLVVLLSSLEAKPFHSGSLIWDQDRWQLACTMKNVREGSSPLGN